MTQSVPNTVSTDIIRNSLPGSHGHFLPGHVRDMQDNVPTFCLRLAHQYGDVARIRLLSIPVYFVSHPHGIKQILQKNHLSYDRNVFLYKPLRPFLGNGLDFTVEHHPIGQAFRTIVPTLADYVLLPFPPLSVPTSRNRRIQRGLHTLNRLVYDMIRERREQKTNTENLFSLSD